MSNKYHSHKRLTRFRKRIWAPAFFRWKATLHKQITAAVQAIFTKICHMSHNISTILIAGNMLQHILPKVESITLIAGACLAIQDIHPYQFYQM